VPGIGDDTSTIGSQPSDIDDDLLYEGDFG